MRRVTGSLFAVAALIALIFWVADHGLAQSPASTAAGNNVTIPAGFNQPPASQSPGSAEAPASSKLPQSGMITINGVNYYLTTKTQYEFWLAWMTVGIGSIAMLLVCVLFYRHLPTKTDDFVKLFAFVVVVFSAMFLIAVGYNDSQTAPVYSLLGTIIGYLFGREFTARQQQAGSTAATEIDRAKPTSAPGAGAEGGVKP